MNARARPIVGPVRLADGSTRFRVWAPLPAQIELCLFKSAHDPKQPSPTLVPMHAVGEGYYEALLSGIEPGDGYAYRLNGTVDRPDPASRFQPLGIHEFSQVADEGFAWTDASWRGRDWDDYVIYEAHVGTFTPAGTFTAMIERLDELVRLGVTALELMPVAQFPGSRNWGYDGVHPYAPQNTYGGPAGLKSLIDACHARSLAVILDVVYNHLGPEGNYLRDFGPYFTDRYRTPWGEAINYDGPQSQAVRDFFIGNAVYWIDEFHVDGLRLDATHAVFDASRRHVLADLAEAVHDRGRELGRTVVVIAENNANDPRIVSPADHGLGLDAQVLDDFQRSLHALVTGERRGYYADFGWTTDFARSVAAGFVMTGQESRYRRRAWGADGSHLAADRFVAYAQNHDTIGNRPEGQRLGRLVGFEALKLSAAAVILSPSIPLLFMGEEYDEPAAFHYFISHLDPALIESVRAGRAREFAAFQGETPSDPQAPETFARSRLTQFAVHSGHHAILWSFYQELLRLRREYSAIRQPSREQATVEAHEEEHLLIATRQANRQQVWLCFNFGDQAQAVVLPAGTEWTLQLDSAEKAWLGPHVAGTAHVRTGRIELAPTSCVLLTRTVDVLS